MSQEASRTLTQCKCHLALIFAVDKKKYSAAVIVDLTKLLLVTVGHALHLQRLIFLFSTVILLSGPQTTLPV